MDKHAKRKAQPVFSAVMMYFKNALLYLSEVSLAGNQQHHANKPLHWDKSKSADELDAGLRHMLDAGKVDDDGKLHSAKAFWRAGAFLERELEYREDHNIPDTKDVDYQDVISYTKEKHTLPKKLSHEEVLGQLGAEECDYCFEKYTSHDLTNDEKLCLKHYKMSTSSEYELIDDTWFRFDGKKWVEVD